MVDTCAAVSFIKIDTLTSRNIKITQVSGPQISVVQVNVFVWSKLRYSSLWNSRKVWMQYSIGSEFLADAPLMTNLGRKAMYSSSASQAWASKYRVSLPQSPAEIFVTKNFTKPVIYYLDNVVLNSQCKWDSAETSFRIDSALHGLQR